MRLYISNLRLNSLIDENREFSEASREKIWSIREVCRSAKYRPARRLIFPRRNNERGTGRPDRLHSSLPSHRTPERHCPRRPLPPHHSNPNYASRVAARRRGQRRARRTRDPTSAIGPLSQVRCRYDKVAASACITVIGQN